MHEFFNSAIVAWSGLLSKIPRGWTLCDGTRGTPDLRDKFIRGAESQGQMRKTGGAPTHNHEMFASNHDHDFDTGTILHSAVGWNPRTSKTAVVETMAPANFEPDFFELAYIMEWEGW